MVPGDPCEIMTSPFCRVCRRIPLINAPMSDGPNAWNNGTAPNTFRVNASSTASCKGPKTSMQSETLSRATRTGPTATTFAWRVGGGGGAVAGGGVRSPAEFFLARNLIFRGETFEDGDDDSGGWWCCRHDSPKRSPSFNRLSSLPSALWW